MLESSISVLWLNGIMATRSSPIWRRRRTIVSISRCSAAATSFPRNCAPIQTLAAMGMRILLLLSIVWISRLTTPLFYILERPISGRDLLLIGGGLFLLAKATIEIHDRLEREEGHRSARVRPSFAAVIIQIVLLDIVFSLDSVITAVGMADQISIMVTAVILA